MLREILEFPGYRDINQMFCFWDLTAIDTESGEMLSKYVCHLALAPLQFVYVLKGTHVNTNSCVKLKPKQKCQCSNTTDREVVYVEYMYRFVPNEQLEFFYT